MGKQPIGRRGRLKTLAWVLIVAVALALLPAPAGGTPVATTEEQREVLGRTFLEPRSSVDYIHFGKDPGTEISEFADGMKLLANLYPRYLTFTTVQRELGSRFAVSTGADGLHPWDPEDSGDGRPLHVAVLTDKRVPDSRKEYAAFTFAHAWEACGREGLIRSIEDMLIWATEKPGRVLRNESGISGIRKKLPAAEVLRRTKIFVVSVNPDGWAQGDRKAGTYSQNTGSGFNGNRLTYQTGWVFPNHPAFMRAGFSTLTEPEGAAATEYLRQVRRKELGGRPFAVGADIHGPIPFGMILLHDQSNDPQKLIRIQDLAARVKQAMTRTQGRYITRPGAETYEKVTRTADEVTWDQRRTLLPLNLPLPWATYGHIFDLIWKTAGASWGGWMNSEAGLGADAITFEMTCRAGPWEPKEQQVFQDTVRSIFQTIVVTAATKRQSKAFAYRLGGNIGFFEHGSRVTSADGNPSPPPRGYPGHPLKPRIRQTPYDVSNTDYFRDLRRLLLDPISEVKEPELDRKLQDLGSFVVADATVGDVALLRSFVRDGGNLVLTDGALKMLPDLLGVPNKRLRVKLRHGYVGYSDLDRRHWLTRHLSQYTKQTYDPIGIGYPTLMERDDYWYMFTDADSGTKNSARIWTLRRQVWEKLGGRTVGTADPPEGRKEIQEGSETNKTTIGVLRKGKGRIVIFGALLPRPSEAREHWFGLDGYAISTAGQEMLLRALSHHK